MTNHSENNRSAFCHLITDYHSANQKRLAKFDFVGMLASGLMITVAVGFMRLLVSH